MFIDIFVVHIKVGELKLSHYDYLYFTILKFHQTNNVMGGSSSRLEKKPTINSWTRHALWLAVKLREEPLKIWTR